MITVENIEVNAVLEETEAGWQTVIAEPKSFDLVAFTGVEDILGATQLQPGRYNQVRMEVVEALITIEGTERTAMVPSGRLRIVGGYDAVAGETTVLTLDFDAEKSVVLRGQNDPLLKPVVRLLVRKSGQPLAEAESISVPSEPTPIPETVPPTPTPTTTPLPPTATAAPVPTPTAAPTSAPPTPTATSAPTPIPEPMAISLSPSKDNTLYETISGTTSNGAGQFLFAGVTNGGEIRRAVIAFDVVGAIPSGSTITSVNLTLQMSRTQAGSETVQLHKLLADWGQGTSDTFGTEGSGTTATSGDATWVHRFFDTDTWQTPGGDFPPTVSASALVSGIASYTWNSTTQLVADVQGWLDTPSGNFGWVLQGNESRIQTAKRFDSMENGTEANRPVLTIEFIPPN